MPAAIQMAPCSPVHGRIRPPGSKSITNRAFICAALADGNCVLEGILDSEDTRVMVQALQEVGIAVEVDWQQRRATIPGQAGRIPKAEAQLYLANSGTSIRFLTAMLSVGSGRFLLDGNTRMRQRPIHDLLDGLQQLGAEVRSIHGTGCPPVELRAAGLTGGTVRVRGDVSSQYLSGLLMACPYAEQPTTMEVRGELVSKPYVTMTLQVMAAFGIETADPTTTNPPFGKFEVPAGKYQAQVYEIEPDASAASYFFAAAAITGGEVTVEGLGRQSLQGDVEFVGLLEQMGCEVDWEQNAITVRGGSLHGIECDMNPISDTVMTLAAVALFADSPTTITGVGHIRHKETDRIQALVNELTKLGANVTPLEDGLRIEPQSLQPARLATYDDHRMAMSLALVGLQSPGVVIEDPGCTRKTYPDFFVDLAQLTKQTFPEVDFDK